MKESTKEIDLKRRLDKALKVVDTTRSVLIGNGVIGSIHQCLTDHFNGKPALIIADTNTFAAAGSKVFHQLKSSGYPLIEPFVFDNKELYGEIRYVEQLEKHLSGKDVLPVAVGSGTINDVTKLAAERCGLPYMVVATAGSMDGYTAFGASISYKGVKQTFNCKAPLAVIADLDVIALAPKEMNASGYADLIAKIPSGADWIIADALGIEPIDYIAWDLTQTHLRDMISNPAGIQTGDKDAIMGLMEGLVMTGLGMQASKTSRPASGAEHQFSHLWDNQHHKYNGIAPSHGFKVGIGSLCSEALYELLLLKEIGDFDIDENSIRTWWSDFNQIEADILNQFSDKDLAEQAIVQCKAKYIRAGDLFQRVQLLKSIWPELKRKLKIQLSGAKKMQNMLWSAGAPSIPEDIGIGRERLKLSYHQAQLIRQRYTILDLVLQTNSWKTCIDPLFEKGGFWSIQKENKVW